MPGTEHHHAGGQQNAAAQGHDGAETLVYKQLGYYQHWLCSLAQAPAQALPLSTVQAAACVVVSGFSGATTAQVREGGTVLLLVSTTFGCFAALSAAWGIQKCRIEQQKQNSMLAPRRRTTKNRNVQEAWPSEEVRRAPPWNDSRIVYTTTEGGSEMGVPGVERFTTTAEDATTRRPAPAKPLEVYSPWPSHCTKVRWWR